MSCVSGRTQVVSPIPPATAVTQSAQSTRLTLARSNTSASLIQTLHQQFMSLILNDTGRKLFYEYLKCGYSEHHLMYWEATQNYRKVGRESLIQQGIPDQHNDEQVVPYHSYQPNQIFTHPIDSTTNSKLQIEAQNIYNEFIKSGVKMQINIAETCRNAIANNLPHATLHIFDEADHIVIELLKGNYFFAFRETDKWKEYLRIKEIEERKIEEQQRKDQSKVCVIL